jgi:hypothetical protein
VWFGAFTKPGYVDPTMPTFAARNESDILGG